MSEDDIYLYGAAGLAALLILRPQISATGRRVLSILEEVVPSTYPSARFSALAPGYYPDDPSLPERFSTCGYLPTYVGRRLGYRDGITRSGTFAVRDVGRATGTWVDAAPGRRPSPGDFYAIGDENGGIVHVGVIVDSSGNTWTTADAGQGTHDVQAAAYVARAYDPAAVTIGGPAGPRPLSGWLNIDKYVRTNPI